MIQSLSSRAKDEVSLTQTLASIEGIMEILLAGSTTNSSAGKGTSGNTSVQSAPTWTPSETASKAFVVNVS